MAAEGFLLTVQGLSQITKVDPLFGIIATQFFLRAMQIDRCIMSGFTQQLDHPLRLAKRVGTNDMASLWLSRD